jgi:AcrR family transcriptional regulator
VRTERSIVEATMRLLATRGIQGTSLDAVAEEVGVSKSSVLWHFGSKEELLLRVAEHVFEDVERGPVKAILALPTLEARSDATWRLFSETLHERPELRRLILHLIFESVEGRPELRARLRQLYGNMRGLFEAGLRGVVPSRSRRERLAIISVAAFDGIFLQWLLDPDVIDLEALHRDVNALHRAAGLIAPKRGGSRHG